MLTDQEKQEYQKEVAELFEAGNKMVKESCGIGHLQFLAQRVHDVTLKYPGAWDIDPALGFERIVFNGDGTVTKIPNAAISLLTNWFFQWFGDKQAVWDGVL